MASGLVVRPLIRPGSPGRVFGPGGRSSEGADIRVALFLVVWGRRLVGGLWRRNGGPDGAPNGSRRHGETAKTFLARGELDYKHSVGVILRQQVF